MEEKEQMKGVENGVENAPEPFANPPALPQIQRAEKGRFKKGYSANISGKSRATLKKIERLKSYMDLALSDRWPRFLEELDSLSGKDYVVEYKNLLEFRFPKLSRLDSSATNNSKVTIQVQHSPDAPSDSLFPDLDVESPEFKILPNE